MIVHRCIEIHPKDCVGWIINFATSITRNFSEYGIRCPCKNCKNKKFLHPYAVTMHLLHKGFIKYLC